MLGAGYTQKFLVAKTTDIALSSVYYFFLALAASIGLNFASEFYESYTLKDKTQEKSMTRLMFEIVANIFFIVFTFWIIRNVVERIPFPLEGYGGYQHAKLSLPTILLLTSVTMLFFQTALMDKVRELNGRIFAKTKLSDTWFGTFMKKTI
jgi:hypothetical protein